MKENNVIRGIIDKITKKIGDFEKGLKVNFIFEIKTDFIRNSNIIQRSSTKR